MRVFNVLSNRKRGCWLKLFAVVNWSQCFKTTACFFGSDMNTSIGSEREELQEKTDGDSDVVPATQPRCHFTRQPVKYIRPQAKIKAAIPRATALTNVATESGAESGSTGGSVAMGVLEESGSGDGDTAALRQRSGGRQQLKRFEITQETARIVSKFRGDEASAPSENPPESAGAAGRAEEINQGTYL